MPVWFKRWLQCADTLQTADCIAIGIGRDFSARLLAGQFNRYRPATGHRGGNANIKHMIVETTACTRGSARARARACVETTEAR
jgi:hypothetical protein